AHALAVARPHELVDAIRLAQEHAYHRRIVDRVTGTALDLPHALRNTVEMRDAVSNTKPHLVLARSFGDEGHVHLDAFDPGTIENVLGATFRVALTKDSAFLAWTWCERCDSRLEHGEIAKTAQALRHRERADVREDDVVPLVLRKHLLEVDERLDLSAVH